MEFDTAIIGSGIAGSCLAYELEKAGADYIICTDQDSPLKNTSSLSYGHCRLALGNGDETIEKSVSMFGEEREKMEFIYSRTGFVLRLLEELGVDFEYRSFGVIPLSGERGGKVILSSLQERIPGERFLTETEVLYASRSNGIFKLETNTSTGVAEISAERLFVATGGYGGRFKHTDNFRYRNYGMFDVIEGLGGQTANMDCVFKHPFGFMNGRKILIGNGTRDSEFVDENDNPIFDEELKNAIRTNAYHERFPEILEQIEKCMSDGHSIYQRSQGDKKIRIAPTVHYTGGGIKTDYIGRVLGKDGKAVENIFAIGECQADGPRNGGRLPGYPFTTAIVYGMVWGDILVGSCLARKITNI